MNELFLSYDSKDRAIAQQLADALELPEHAKGMEYIKWKLLDQDSVEIFNTWLGCGTPGARRSRPELPRH